jgi:flagellar biosynthetic protein FliO
MPWSFWSGYLEKLALVALVLCALYLLVRRLRQTPLFAREDRCLKLLESLMLSQHATLHVVCAGTRYFLIGSTAGGVTKLAELASSDAQGQTLK